MNGREKYKNTPRNPEYAASEFEGKKMQPSLVDGEQKPSEPPRVAHSGHGGSSSSWTRENGLAAPLAKAKGRRDDVYGKVAALPYTGPPLDCAAFGFETG